MKFYFFIGILLLLTLICAAQEEKLSFYIQEKIEAYGPIFGEESTNSSRISFLMFLKPLITDYHFNVEPILFANVPEGEQMLNGKMKYTFYLRENVFWHDGTPVTAHDIEYTYRIIKNPKVMCTTVRGKVRDIVNMYAKDQTTLEVTFNQKNNDNYGCLTFSILPKHIFNTADRDDPYFIEASESFFKDNPMGNGMYKKSSIFQGMFTQLTKNSDYYDQEKMPKFGRIEIKYKELIAPIMEEFLGSEEINFAVDIPVTRIDEVADHPDYDYVPYIDYSWSFIAFNLRQPIFQDKEFRKAINLGVDKAEINMNIYNGEADIITGPFPVTSEAYNSTYQDLMYDPSEARNVLLRNNYLDNNGNGIIEFNGSEITLNLVMKKGSEEDEHLATSLTNYFKAIGIDLTISDHDSESYNKKVFQDRDFDMALVSFKFGTDPSIYYEFHSSQDVYNGFNVCGMHDPEIDKLLEEAEEKANREDRFKLYKILHEKVANEYPGIFLWQKPKYIGFSKDITGIKKTTIDPINIFKYIHKW